MSDAELRKIVDTIPTLTWRTLPDGSLEFHNQRWQDFTGLSAEQSHGSGWTVSGRLASEILPSIQMRRELLL